MYILGYTGDAVYQYSLSTAWDLSTASYDSVSFSVLTQDTAGYDLAFSSDGSYFYMVGATNDFVYQYTMSTPWSISTASYTRSYSVATYESNATGISFNATGSEMYILGTTYNAINRFTLTTPWDISTATYVSQIGRAHV